MMRYTVLVVLYTCGLALAAEPADPLRPPTIATENVPAVSPEIFDRLRQYQSIRSAAFAGWSPTGQGMLIQTRFGNATQLHQVFEPGGRREQLTFFDEPVGGRFIPKAADGSLLVTMSRGGNEDYQVYLLDRQKFNTTLLTDGKSRNELGPVSRDGQKMIVHSNRRNGRDVDVYVADCRKPDSLELILERPGEYWSAHDWSQDGRSLLMSRYVSINESYPALFDLESKQLKPLPLPAEGKAAVGAMAFSPDGRSAYVVSDARGEFLELYQLKLETLKYEPLTSDILWDVESVEVNRHTGDVAFTVNEDGASRLYLLHEDEWRKLDIPLGIVSGLEFSPDGKQLGFSLSRPDSPADAYSLETVTGKLTRWTYSETGGLDPATFVQPDHVQFSSFDGRQIPAYVFRPRYASIHRRVPVLISIHGGPESQYRPGFEPLTQLFVNQLGLCVISPNVRGSAGYGKTYLKLDNGPLREESVKDIGALLDWIATQPELDDSRVGVIGGSYGGYMVLASLVHFGDRLRTGIDIVGIANFITFLEHTSPYRQDLRRAEYGDERDPTMRAAFERINPSAHAERIRSALLVAHGKNDPRVPFSEAQQIADRVRAAGRTVWTVYAENEGHGFAKRDNRDYLTAVEVLFMQQNLIAKP